MILLLIQFMQNHYFMHVQSAIGKKRKKKIICCFGQILCAHTHTQSVIKCECAGGHLHELEVLERVHLYSGLCSRSSRGDRWEGGQVTLNIPSAPATERPLTPEHHFHPLARTHNMAMHSLTRWFQTHIQYNSTSSYSFSRSEAGQREVKINAVFHA